ncbi:peptide chain release factor H [Zhouia sp. PK063]|uniref:peptide chain release factor H n=1 Tax=Zhouia sp. PK063 TaxID=3373602 RepID=UPI0037904267
METIIQITAGKGPAECTWVVAQVLKTFMEEAKAEKIEVEVLEKENGTENGTINSVLLFLSGKHVSEFSKKWMGTVQWIGKSKFRKFHKRKNWFIGIFELEKLNWSTITEKDIKYQASRSSGAGGQHVNKVSSAIRATHIPTGISVQAMDSRSQHQNKKLAKQRLLLKLNDKKLKEYQEQFQQQWNNQLQVQRGNPVRVFTGSDFKKRKTDHTYKKQRQALKQQLRNESE